MRVLQFVILTLTCLLASWVNAAPSGTVFTANEREGSISQFNLKNNTNKVTAVSVMPHNVQISADGKYLFAVGMTMAAMDAHAQHSDESPQGKLLVFSLPMSNEPSAVLDVHGHAAHVVSSLDGKIAYVTNSSANTVEVFDLQSHKPITAIAVGQYPHGLRLNSTGTLLYVANMKDGSISVIDTKQMKEITRIKVGNTPVQVAITPDDKTLYVSLSAENKVGVVDLATQKLIKKIAVNDNPIQLFATPDGKEIYAANQGTPQKPDNRVSVINTNTQTVTHTIKTDKGAHGVVVSDDGQYVFVTNTVVGTFSVIDTASHKLVASHQVGDGPNGITYTKESY